MSLRLSIINDRLDDLAESSGDPPDAVFMKFVCSTLRNTDYEDLEPEDVVDGGEDKQIDVLSLEEAAPTDPVNVFILQSKNTDGFSSNALTLMGNGLSWIFEKPKSEYAAIGNHKFARKIAEVREARARLGASNLCVSAFFVTKGDSSKLSREFQQELNAIRRKYTAADFGSFRLEVFGASELVTLLEEIERKQKQVDDILRINYDMNRASYISYSAHGIRGVICTTSGREIARLVTQDREKAIFDLNLRRFYGIRKGRVNTDIARTCSSENEGFKFWFFNNGITIVCDKCDVVADADHSQIILKNIQIVNGCQTSMTLAAMARDGVLRDDVNVLVKIFVTNDNSFLGRIVLTTNNQNSISSRDLKANDIVQIDYQRAFEEIHSLRYERKPREFKGLSRDEQRKVISNEKVGQAYLAVVKKKPTIARTQKYRLWDPALYDEVFPSTTVEKHLLSYLIYDFVWRQKGEALERWKNDEIRYSIVSYGVFHVARVAAFYFTAVEDWKDAVQLRRWIDSIICRPNVLKMPYQKAVTLIKNIIKKRPDWTENINNLFKANDIEIAINRSLKTRT